MILADSVTQAPAETFRPADKSTNVREKVRIRFRKSGPLRFISHNDLLRCWDRLLRRSGLPVRFTEGFHPKPRMSSPLSLALGIEGLDEILEIELSEPAPAASIASRLNEHAVEGLSVFEVTTHPAGERAQVVAVEYVCPLPPDTTVTELEARAAELIARTSVPIERRIPNKPVRAIDARPYLLGLTVTQRHLWIRLKVTPTGTVRPEEILNVLGIDHLLREGSVIARTRVELASS